MLSRSNQEDKIDLFIQKEALKVLLTLKQVNTPLEKYKRNIILLMSALGMSAYATSEQWYTRIFLKEQLGISDLVKIWSLAVPSGIPTVCLSFKTNMSIQTRLARFLEHVSREELFENRYMIIPFGMSVFSALTGAIIGLRAYEETFNSPIFNYIFTPLRFYGSLGLSTYISVKRFKELFAVQRDMLLAIKKQILNIEDLKLIYLYHNGFLKKINNISTQSTEKNLISLLRDLKNCSDEKKINVVENKSWTKTIFGNLIALCAAPAYLASGLNVSSSWLIKILCAGSAFAMNQAMYATASIELLNIMQANISECYNKGFSNYCKQFSATDGVKILTTFILSLGNSLHGGGITLKNPFPNYAAVAKIEAFASFVVTGALSSVTVSKFLNSIQDKWSEQLYLDALASKNLLNFYMMLSDKKQKTLAHLIRKHVIKSMESIIESLSNPSSNNLYNKIEDEINLDEVRLVLNIFFPKDEKVKYNPTEVMLQYLSNYSPEDSKYEILNTELINQEIVAEEKSEAMEFVMIDINDVENDQAKIVSTNPHTLFSSKKISKENLITPSNSSYIIKP